MVDFLPVTRAGCIGHLKRTHDLRKGIEARYIVSDPVGPVRILVEAATSAERVSEEVEAPPHEAESPDVRALANRDCVSDTLLDYVVDARLRLRRLRSSKAHLASHRVGRDPNDSDSLRSFPR